MVNCGFQTPRSLKVQKSPGSLTDFKYFFGFITHNEWAIESNLGEHDLKWSTFSPTPTSTGCSVPKCSNRGGHRYPSDPELKKKWIIAIKIALKLNKRVL